MRTILEREEEDGVRSKGRKGKDKARRTHELFGSYSAKHLRIRDEQLAAKGKK